MNSQETEKGPSTTSFTLKLNNSVLEEVEQFKYLGVMLCHSLSWSPHISAICAKVRKILCFYNHSSDDCLKQLYLSLVRPHSVYQPFAHSNAFLNSFVPSGARAWNSLTEQQLSQLYVI